MYIRLDNIIYYFPFIITFLLGLYYFPLQIFSLADSNKFILIIYLFQLPLDLNISNTTYIIYDYKYTTQYLQLININPFDNPYNLTEPIVPKDYKNYNRNTRYSGLLVREIYDFFHLNNVICGFHHILDTNGNYYNYPYIPTDRPLNSSIHIDMSFPNVVWCDFKFTSFGHWFHDHLASLLKIPNYVWETSPVIISRCGSRYVSESVKVLGLHNCELILKSVNFFAENLYFVHTPELFLGFTYQTYNLLRNKILKYYKTDKIIPNAYNCMNKEPNWHRHIHNMNELIEMLKISTKQKWGLIPNNYTNVSYISITFASTKLLVIPQGSITFNMFYMHPKTGILFLMSETLDICNFSIAFLLGIWTISQLHKNIPFVGGNGGSINISQAITNVFRLMYTLDHQKYPVTSDLIPFFRMKELRQSILKNIIIVHRFI